MGLRHSLHILFLVGLFAWNALSPTRLAASPVDVMQNLTIQDGLSDNKVNSIYRDEKGLMWFGTDYGLSRYDGMSFRNFTVPDAYNRISSVQPFTQNVLGVQVDSQWHAFSLPAEKFLRIVMEKPIRGTILGIQPVDASRCWIIASRGFHLCRIEERQGNELHVFPLKSIGIDGTAGSTARITAYSFDEERKLCHFTDGHSNLYRFSTESSQISRRVHFYPKDTEVRCICTFNGSVWIGTIANGLIQYHETDNHLRYFNYNDTQQENRLSHTDVYALIPIGKRKLLAATWNGYTVIESIGDKFVTHIYSNVSFPNPNVETRMICAYYDTHGTLWLGTHGGGVLYWSLLREHIHQYLQDRHNEICAITSDREGHLWMATFHRGVLRSDAPFSAQLPLTFSTPEKATERKASALCLFNDERKNQLWTGNKDGSLTMYDCTTCASRSIKLEVDGTENHSAVWSLFTDRQGRHWIGTENGLLRYDEAKGKCVRVKCPVKDISVRAITQTTDGGIWIGTDGNGLGKLSADGKSVTLGYGKEHKLQNVSVRSLLATVEGDLYVGYSIGLGVVNPKQGTVTQFFNTQNGLCNNFIGCLMQDTNGHIWVGSNSCISRFSRKQQLFYHYFISGSNRSAFTLGKYLFWGNNRNLTYFDPTYLHLGSENEKPCINALEVGNNAVDIGETVNGQVILKKSLAHTSAIELNHRNRDFSLSFCNQAYTDRQQKLRYRLYPYQKEWTVTDKGEKVSFYNLEAGKYVFELQTLYPDERIGQLASLNIIILPHWTERLWFRLLLLTGAILVLAWMIHRSRIRQRRLRHEMQLQQEVFTANIERDHEKRMRMERENFFTNAAHELRTPLTLVLAPLKEIMSSLSPQDKLYEKISMILRNGESLHTLVDHLLSVQKIEAGMMKLQITRCDIVLLTQTAAAPFRQLAQSKHIHFQLSLPAEPLFLWIDEAKAQEAIGNLLSNAFKYTPQGGSVAIGIEPTEMDGHPYCRITVTDNGQGIAEEFQSRIFDSFITAPASPQFSTKMGIGLHIVKNTMDLHHGIVTLKSRVGEGSTFTLYFPQGKEHFVNDSQTGITPQTPSDHPDTDKPYSILIVEDNDEMRQYLGSLFCKNYTVYQATNGEEGVQMAKEKEPSIVLSDVMMPVKDGFCCAKELRETPETAHIPILLLTARSEEEDVLHGIRTGADDYLSKPFNPEILKEKVQSLIAGRERLKRLYSQTLQLKPSEEKTPEVTDEFLRQVIQVIEANLSDEEFNVKQLAEQLHISQPTLYRKLKQVSALSAIDMIRSIRMSKAAQLILEHKYNIQEITEMVGYSDARTLRKHFQEQFGVVPSQYS